MPEQISECGLCAQRYIPIEMTAEVVQCQTGVKSRMQREVEDELEMS